MWIKASEKEKEAKKGKIYWATTIKFGKPNVVACRYMGNNQWKDADSNRTYSKIEGWWDEPQPEPMKIEKKKPYLTFPDFEVNDRGINKKIQIHLLPEEEMRTLGFTDYREGYWYFCRGIVSSISFSISINKDDPTDFRIDVLDDDFCQPYEYQAMLSKESYSEPNKVAVQVYEAVEKWMAFLEVNGIVSGHVKGEYI